MQGQVTANLWNVLGVDLCGCGSPALALTTRHVSRLKRWAAINGCAAQGLGPMRVPLLVCDYPSYALLFSTISDSLENEGFGMLTNAEGML